MWQRAERRVDRITVEPNRNAISPLVILLFLAALTSYAAAPSVWLLVISRRLGYEVGGALYLTHAGLISLYVLLTLMYLGSLVLKGLGKAMFDARYVHSAWLVLLALVVTLGVLTMTVQANAAVSGLRAGAGNSNGQMLVAFAVWLFSVNNAAASVGNEVADRFAARFEPWFFAGKKNSRRAEPRS